MDRLAGGLDREAEALEPSAFPFASEHDGLIERSIARLAIPERLFQLSELDVLYDSDTAAIWTFMRPSGRPSFTRASSASMFRRKC